ncbi:hypothetical protein ACFOLG_07170 [Vogesella facilis]|uniref:Uncharacterized protein n=1 Tax=Vogesella facilis TaxID=1655232 RepID=A0ABV7RCQ7_9NEIS
MYVELGGQPQRVNTVFCIGRHYVAPAAELGHALELEPAVVLTPLRGGDRLPPALQHGPQAGWQVAA